MSGKGLKFQVLEFLGPQGEITAMYHIKPAAFTC